MNKNTIGNIMNISASCMPSWPVIIVTASGVTNTSGIAENTINAENTRVLPNTGRLTQGYDFEIFPLQNHERFQFVVHCQS